MESPFMISTAPPGSANIVSIGVYLSTISDSTFCIASAIGSAVFFSVQAVMAAIVKVKSKLFIKYLFILLDF